MGHTNINTIIGFAVAAITMALGIMMLTGWFFPEGTPTQLRVTFGIVLMLLSIYRAVVTYTRRSHARPADE